MTKRYFVASCPQPWFFVSYHDWDYVAPLWLQKMSPNSRKIKQILIKNPSLKFVSFYEPFTIRSTIYYIVSILDSQNWQKLIVWWLMQCSSPLKCRECSWEWQVSADLICFLPYPYPDDVFALAEMCIVGKTFLKHFTGVSGHISLTSPLIRQDTISRLDLFSNSLICPSPAARLDGGRANVISLKNIWKEYRGLIMWMYHFLNDGS